MKVCTLVTPDMCREFGKAAETSTPAANGFFRARAVLIVLWISLSHRF
jgi:hypothetical protein